MGRGDLRFLGPGVLDTGANIEDYWCGQILLEWANIEDYWRGQVLKITGWGKYLGLLELANIEDYRRGQSFEDYWVFDNCWRKM